MDLIIDKANIISLLSSGDDSAIFECTRLIKRGIRVCFNFNKEDININSREESKILMWLTNLADGRKSPLPIWEKSIISADIKSNFATNLSADQKRSIFLLDNQEVIPKIQAKGAILIGNVGQEVGLLMSLMLEDTEIATSKISSWHEYCPALPLTDIIISDNHFFNNSYVYSKNRDELISALTKVVNQSPVNCVIVFNSAVSDNSLDWNDVVKSLKNSIRNITGSSKSKITLIETHSMHDRNAITNYYRIKNGSCFHLKDNGLKHDVTTEIKTHANIVYENRTNELIALYQQAIDKGTNIYGDKKSNFLKFPD